MTEEWQGPTLGARLLESKRKWLKNGRGQLLVSDLLRCPPYRVLENVWRQAGTKAGYPF